LGALLVERSVHYRPEQPLTLASGILVDRQEGGLERVQAAVPGVPCRALFGRGELEQGARARRSAATTAP
jgi:hypothetical protein